MLFLEVNSKVIVIIGHGVDDYGDGCSSCLMLNIIIAKIQDHTGEKSLYARGVTPTVRSRSRIY